MGNRLEQRVNKNYVKMALGCMKTCLNSFIGRETQTKLN